MARWAAAVSVVTKGLPVPAARMTMRLNGCHDARLAAEGFETVLQGEGVDDSGEHAHVVGCRFLNARMSAFELRAAENIAAADDETNLAAGIGSLLDLSGDLRDFLHADAALAGMAKAFAGEF
jgi:hypothetical protein